MRPQLLSQILTALNNDNNSTVYNLLIATLRSQDPSHSDHRNSILSHFPDLFNLLSEQSNKDFTTTVVKSATAAYQEEIQALILKQSGLHFDGSHTGLSQLEGFSISELGHNIQQIAPHLWHLVGSMLDVVPDRRRTRPSNMMVDEDIEMELGDIATAVEGLEGNDEGSGESDDNELEGGNLDTIGRAEGEANAEEDTDSDESDNDTAGREPEGEAGNDKQPSENKKRCYRKQNRARRNAALIYIVSLLFQLI